MPPNRLVVHITRMRSRWQAMILACQMTAQSIRPITTAAMASAIPRWEGDAGSFSRQSA